MMSVSAQEGVDESHGVFWGVLFFSFFKILFIYLRETASERGNTSRGSGRGRSRLIAEEPDVGLDPSSLVSHPELKAGTQ